LIELRNDVEARPAGAQLNSGRKTLRLRINSLKWRQFSQPQRPQSSQRTTKIFVIFFVFFVPLWCFEISQIQ
jgi:hypothetical protein